MNTVSLETAVFGGYAIAAVAFCLGYVTSRVVALRERREAQATWRTTVRITGTGRPSRWPSAHDIDRQMRAELDAAPAYAPTCACGYVRCICTEGGPQ